MTAQCECEETKCPEGIPAWVMTFADLMSLLLAFFVLLFSFSEMDNNLYKQMAGSMKDAFGVQRDIHVKDPPKGINIIAQEFSPGKTMPTPYNEVRQSTTDDYKEFPVFTDASEEGQENESKDIDDGVEDKYEEQSNMEMVVEDEQSINDFLEISRIRHDGEMIEEVLEKELESGLMELEIGDKQIILRIREKGSFASGSAKLIEPFKEVSTKISEAFKGFQGQIIVSGHTDNVPIKSWRFRSNWELSASRAVTVIHELQKDPRMHNLNMQIAAYAETRPLDSNTTKEGRARNRRVEIMLLYEGHSQSNPPAMLRLDSDQESAGNEHMQPVLNKPAMGTAQQVSDGKTSVRKSS